MENKKYSKAVQRRARMIFENEKHQDIAWSSVVINEVVGFKKQKKQLSRSERERYLKQAEKEELGPSKAKTKTKAKAKTENS
jgi:hypothetical protein